MTGRKVRPRAGWTGMRPIFLCKVKGYVTKVDYEMMLLSYQSSPPFLSFCRSTYTAPASPPLCSHPSACQQFDSIPAG